MEEILSLARKVAEAAEVFRVTSEETSVQFEANYLKHIHGKQSVTTTLRVIKNGRIGYGIVSGESNNQKLVDMAVETAQFGMPAYFEFPSSSAMPTVNIFDPAVPVISTEVMVKPGEELIEKMTGHTPDIMCQGGVTKDIITIDVINSRGGEAHYRKTTFSLVMEGTLVRGTDMLFVGDGESSCHPILDTVKVSGRIVEQLELAKNQATITTRPMPVIFTPNGVASAFISPLISAFNGKLVLEGASPIGKKLGDKVFDTKFSLYDDATIAFQPESRPCDDEGVASQRTALIEKGIVANFYYDLQTAGMARKKSTGNGSRNRGTVTPAPSALVINSGDTTFEEMLAGIKEGLVIEQLMGAEQGNVLGGDFSGNVLLGFKVENGKMVGRVKDTMVSGNIYQLFKEITLGKDARWVSGFLLTPHIYCPSLSVASK